MELINQIKSINFTSLEIFLLVILLLMIVVIYFKNIVIEEKQNHINTVSIKNVTLFNMYMELSKSSMIYVQKWQKSIEENKALIEYCEKLKASSPK